MKLHNYQERAVEFMAAHNRCILSIDMGLGKTASVIHYLDRVRPSSCLIVAPKRVAETVWLQEAEKWGKDYVAERMIIVAGDKRKRAKALACNSKPYKIIGRDNVNDVKDAVVDCLVIDELTSFKTPTSARTKAICTIRAHAKIGLTGTFLANGAIDIYGQCMAVSIDDRFGSKNFYAWRAAYFRDKLAGSGLNFQKWVLRGKLDELLEPIREQVFTLSAADYLAIPPVTEMEHPIYLTPAERDAYDSMDAFLGGVVGGDIVTVQEGAKFAKLQTMCNGFIYLDDGTSKRQEESSKLEAVAEFCDRCASEGEQVLLFFAYRDEAAWLAEKLKARGVKFDGVWRKGFADRWNAGECGVLFAHPSSAGHGLNLQQGGHIVCWSSVTYNYELFAQANARLARQGQTKPVQIHYFNAVNTCEQRQRKALIDKAEAQGLFVNLTKKN